METPLILYCYDAYCGWCYGFSPVMKRLAADFNIEVEVLSGGMILPDAPTPVAVIAPHVLDSYKNIESLTGVRFGRDYLWHMENPDKTDWFPNSEKPAIALCVFKDYYPDKTLEFASDLQYALNFEGRDLTDNEAYRHLLTKYAIPAEEFYQKLADDIYKDKAHYEFMLCKHLKVSGYPAVFLQVSANKLYALANGYTDYGDISARLTNILAEVTQQ